MERNGEITNHLAEFYEGLPIALEHIGLPQLIPLMGDLIPAGKDCVPLQAADVLCWYTRRANEGNLNAIELMRYKKIARRKGQQIPIDNGYITELWEGLHKDA